MARHPGRTARRIALGGAGAMLAVAAAWFWALPRLIDQRARGALAALGFAQAQLHVARISLGAVELTGVALDPGGLLRAERVRVGFDLPDLLRGRLREIVVEDALWNVQAADGRLSLAPLDQVRGREQVPAPSEAAGALPHLPIDRIELRRCRLRIAAGGDVEEVTCAAQVEQTAGTLRVAFTAQARDQVFEATAELRDTGGAAAGVVTLQVGEPAAPLRLAGEATLTAHSTGLGCALDLHGDAGAFRAVWRGRGVAGNGARLRVSACTEPLAGGRTGAWDVALAVAEGGELTLFGSAWSALEGLAARGTLRFAGDLDVSRLADATSTLRVEALEMQAGEDAWRAAGIGLDLSLQGLPPARATAPPGQQLRWGTFAIGELVAGAGSVEFAVEPGPVLAVAGARCAVGERGSLTTGAFRLAPQSIEVATRLTLQDVPLRPWLDLISQGRVSGEGLLTGWLVARVRTAPVLDIDLAEGRLQAAGGGAIRLLDDPETHALVAEHLAAVADGSGKSQGVVQDRIVDSLKDFVFDALSFELVGSGERLDLRTHIAGRGRKVPQQLDLNINLNGFDALIDLALDVKLGLARAKERARQTLAPPPTKG